MLNINMYKDVILLISFLISQIFVSLLVQFMAEFLFGNETIILHSSFTESAD